MSTQTIYENLLAQANRIFRHSRQGSYKTRERYGEAMRRFCWFLAEVYHLEKLANLSPKHLYAYVDYLQDQDYAPATIKTDLSAIRYYHDQMTQPRYLTLPDNAAFALERRSFGKVDRTWSTSEFARMVELAKRCGRMDYVTVLHLARYVGLRIHECFRLDTAAASQAVQTGALTVKGKGGKMRTVPVDEATRALLASMLASTARGHKLFVPDDEMTDRVIKRFQAFLYRHREEARDPDTAHPLTCHGLRHTYAAEQFRAHREKNGDRDAQYAVSRLLGHERPDVTNIYLASVEKGGV